MQLVHSSWPSNTSFPIPVHCLPFLSTATNATGRIPASVCYHLYFTRCPLSLHGLLEMERRAFLLGRLCCFIAQAPSVRCVPWFDRRVSEGTTPPLGPVGLFSIVWVCRAAVLRRRYSAWEKGECTKGGHEGRIWRSSFRIAHCYTDIKVLSCRRPSSPASLPAPSAPIELLLRST